jgi:hypothetical protein
MIINIVVPPDSSQDIQILHGIIAHIFKEDLKIRHVPYHHPHCEQADINIFFQIINPSLLIYASKNIWIPIPIHTPDTWKPYGKMVNEIWAMTHEIRNIFEDWNPNVKYIGWSSIDKVMPEIKNYHKGIVPVGSYLWRNPKPLIQAYLKIYSINQDLFRALPEMTIITRLQMPDIPENIAPKFNIIKEIPNEKEYDLILHESGVMVCLSANEGFCHSVHEGMSSGCILIVSPLDSLMEMTKTALWVSEAKTIKHPKMVGNLMDVEVMSICESLKMYANYNFHQKQDISKKMRERYELNHKNFIEKATEVIRESLSGTPTYDMKEIMPKEEDLPMISVLTITKDRRRFIPLMKFCMEIQTYPQEKIEWVIVDDGKDQIKDLISDIPNVKYILRDEEMTIGAKRNLAVESASHDILLMLDDDDIYPNNSIITRVSFLLAKPTRECAFSTTIPCYDMIESKSFMNIPPIMLGMSERVSEATLTFTRSFWNSRKFEEVQIAEGNAFIRGREQMCREISPQEVIVSLIHKSNTSSRKTPPMEQNGCHYGFSDELFKVIHEI